MVIKLKPEVRRTFQKAVQNNQEVGRLLRYLINPMAVAGYALAAWRIGADLQWTDEFFISSGLLSHWQVWLALALGAQFGGAYLGRAANEAPTGLDKRAIASYAALF